MAQNPVLAGPVRKGGSPVATSAVWGRTHLNVGWFDDVDDTLDLAACSRLGVDVIRRPVYGGGTAFYQEGCAVMWGFFLSPDQGGTLDEKLARFQPVLLDALDRIGLGAVGYEGSSDFRWRGRKLGALTAQEVMGVHNVGGFLNIAPPDIDLYLQVVRVPDEKFKDKAVKDMREYVCTAEEVAGRPVSYDEFRDALVGALTDSGVEIEIEALTDAERSQVADIAAYLSSEDQVRRVSSERFAAAAPPGSRVGFGNEKGGKLCRAGVAIDSAGVVVAAMMAGDMHVGPPDTMDRIADALVGADSEDEAGVKSRVAAIFEAPDVVQPEAAAVTTDHRVAAIRKAVAQATAQGRAVAAVEETT